MHALAAHAHHFLSTLTLEQACALTGAACAVGRLLLQGLALWRGQVKQTATR